MSQCEKCEALLEAYCNGEISDEDRIFCQEHIAQCQHCHEVLKAEEQLNQLLNDWAESEVEPPEQFHHDLMNKLASVPHNEKMAPIPKVNKYARRWMPVAAAAALILALSPVILDLGAKPLDQFAEQDARTPAEETLVVDEQPIEEATPKAASETPKQTNKENAKEQSNSVANAGAKIQAEEPESASFSIHANEPGKEDIDNGQMPRAMMMDSSTEQQNIGADAQAASLDDENIQLRSKDITSVEDEWANKKETLVNKIEELKAQKAKLEQGLTGMEDSLAKLEKDISRLEKALQAIEDQDFSTYFELMDENQ